MIGGYRTVTIPMATGEVWYNELGPLGRACPPNDDDGVACKDVVVCLEELRKKMPTKLV